MSNARVQGGALLLHRPQEKLGEHLPLDAQRLPNEIEIDRVHVILGDGQSVRDIQHGVPPSPRNKYGLPGLLNANQGFQVFLFTFQDLGQSSEEEVHGLACFAAQLGNVLALDDPLGDFVRENDPELVALETDVPGGGVQRVDVHLRPRTARADQ